MSARRATPLFVDTSALYAHLDGSDENHEPARAVLDGIGAGELAYRPLYVTGYVLGELSALSIRYLGPTAGIDAVSRLLESSLFEVLHPTESEFRTAFESARRYDDHPIALVDHLTATMARDRDVSSVFTFDADFRTLGFSLVPGDADVG